MTPAADPPSRRRAGVRAEIVPVLLLVLMPMALVTTHVLTFAKVSPIDEMVHIDYLLRSPMDLPVRTGELLREPALREVACRGIDSGFEPPSCTDPVLRPQDFEIPYNTASVHPPTYYVLTALPARVLAATSGVDSVVTAARLLGGLWLVAGLLVTYAVGRGRGLGRWPLVGLLLAVSAVPGVHYYASIVNPDAMSVLVGAVVLLLFDRWSRAPHGRGWWLLALAAAVAAMVKVQNILLIGTLALALVVLGVGGRSWRERPRPAADQGGGRFGYLKVPVLVSAAAVSLVAVWTVLVGALTVFDPGPLPVDFSVPAYPWERVPTEVGAFLPPLAGTRPLVTLGTGMLLPTYLATLVLGAGVIGSVMFRAGRLTRALGTALLAMGLLGPSLLSGATYLLTGGYFPTPSRYGLALLPAMVLVTAAMLRRGLPGWLLLAVGVVACGASTVSMLLA